MSEKCRVLIIGAAGRDFHNFNMIYRGVEGVEVVAFTAAQIPDIDGRKYPAELAGVEQYPDGIPIYPESDLFRLIEELEVDEAILSYSDLPPEKVIELMGIVNAAGADFIVPEPFSTMVHAESKPVVSVTAVRTGCGKSAVSRYIAGLLREKGLKVASARHPMPYGDLAAQAVQRFATVDDLAKHRCTIEEMEEYEPHVMAGGVVFAGVDYQAILAEAEKEADVVIWDGGNNDTPFFNGDLKIVLVDPHRPGDERTYYPSSQNVRMAGVVLVTKCDTADETDIEAVEASVREMNPEATIIRTSMPFTVDKPEELDGKRALVIEDGPTLTHGGMGYGAGTLAAQANGAETVDPRPWLQGSLVSTFETYSDIGQLLPAMGYGDQQVRDLEATIKAAIESGEVDVVVSATPIDIQRVLKIEGVPLVRVQYELGEIEGQPTLTSQLEDIMT